MFSGAGQTIGRGSDNPRDRRDEMPSARSRVRPRMGTCPQVPTTAPATPIGKSGNLSVRCPTIAHMFGSTLQRTHNRLHRGLELLVLPEADNLPARSCQRSIGSSVAFDVPAKLWRPVPLVRRRLSTVLGADMPKTAVNEHSDFAGGEHDVRTDLHRADIQAKILAIAIPQPVERTAKHYLWFGVSSPVRSHVPRPPGIHRSRVHAALMGYPSSSFCFALSHVHTGCTRNLALRKDTPDDWPGRRRPQHRKVSL